MFPTSKCNRPTVDRISDFYPWSRPDKPVELVTAVLPDKEVLSLLNIDPGLEYRWPCRIAAAASVVDPWELASQTVVEIRELFGSRLVDVVLFGSHARNNATDESELDCRRGRVIWSGVTDVLDGWVCVLVKVGTSARLPDLKQLGLQFRFWRSGERNSSLISKQTSERGPVPGSRPRPYDHLIPSPAAMWRADKRGGRVC